MIGGMLYSTTGTQRAVIAADAATGETKPMWQFDEGARARVARWPRPARSANGSPPLVFEESAHHLPRARGGTPPAVVPQHSRARNGDRRCTFPLSGRTVVGAEVAASGL